MSSHSLIVALLRSRPMDNDGEVTIRRNSNRNWKNTNAAVTFIHNQVNDFTKNLLSHSPVCTIPPSSTIHRGTGNVAIDIRAQVSRESRATSNTTRYAFQEGGI